MIKALKKYQVQLTPFEATREWSLNNIENDNLLLFESTGSDDGMPYALEFIDYSQGPFPVDNNECNIALEQQDSDFTVIEQGQKATGLVYPTTELKNPDGTFMRSIYSQVKTMFYNNYIDPSKIWGIENIDFELGQTKRLLADQFRLFNIPRHVFGDKMSPNSIQMNDNTLDNPYTIVDDGNGNLFAGTSLFSHQQELGEYINEFIADLTSSYCDYYWQDHTPRYYDSASMTIGFFAGAATSQLHEDTSSMSIGFVIGSTAIAPPFIDLPNMTVGFYHGSASNSVITITASNAAETSSMYVNFVSGTITNTVFTITASNPAETSSMNVNFVSGSLVTTTFLVTASNAAETSSMFINFVSGTFITTTFPITMSFDSSSMTVGFVSGNLR